MSTKGNAENYVELRGSLNIPEAIKGDSAYDIALKNGFVGTEKEWLDSLSDDAAEKAADAAMAAVGEQLGESVERAEASEQNAAASAVEAETSKLEASTSASNALLYASNASRSASAASTSETNAATSETDAEAAAEAAATSAAAAATSEVNAAASAEAAAASAAEAALAGSIVQETGDGETVVMSQGATTRELNQLSEEIADVKHTQDVVGIKTVTLINELGDAGDFTATNQWMVTKGSLEIEDNTAHFSVTGLYEGIRPALIPSFTLAKDHVLYFWAMIKTTEEQVTLSFNSFFGVKAPTTGEFAFVSNWAVNTRDRSQPITVTDNGSAYGGDISVKKVGYIDLTACYGEGNEPDKETMDALMAESNYWFSEKTIYTWDSDKTLVQRVAEIEKTTKETLLHNLPYKTVLIFGDSITQTNDIATDGTLNPIKTNWPTYAMSQLGVQKWYNYAKDGASYHDVNGSADFMTFAKQFEAAKAAGITPDVVIVSLGTNDYQHDNSDTYDAAMSVTSLDTLDRTKLNQALRYCYWTLTEHYPSAVVYAATPIQRPDVKVFTLLRDAIIKMAQTYNVRVIDAGTESGICEQYETWGAEGRYLSDGLHPNTAGKKKLGAYYAQKILTTYNVID